MNLNYVSLVFSHYIALNIQNAIQDAKPITHAGKSFHSINRIIKPCFVRNRCGEKLTDSYTCACDVDCSYFGDCCEDYANMCQEDIIPMFFQNNYKSFDCIGKQLILPTNS